MRFVDMRTGGIFGVFVAAVGVDDVIKRRRIFVGFRLRGEKAKLPILVASGDVLVKTVLLAAFLWRDNEASE